MNAHRLLAVVAAATLVATLSACVAKAHPTPSTAGASAPLASPSAVASVSSSAPATPAAVAHPVVTTAGYGDLRLGSAVPSDTTLVR